MTPGGRDLPRMGRPQLAETRRNTERIVALCDEREQTRDELIAAVPMTLYRMKHRLEACSQQGLLVCVRRGNERVWLTPAALERLRPALHAARVVELEQAQAERTPAAPKLPPPTVEIRDGVRITRAPAPPGRFDVELKPGRGVISADWYARRQGVAVPTRLPHLAAVR